MPDELTPQQHEQVRRLLAEARHTEPMPAEVAARLDRALAQAAVDPEDADGPGAAEGSSSVVRLGERRRRGARLLLAAAAVVVAGVAVGQLVPRQEAMDAGSAGDEGTSQGLSPPERDGEAEDAEESPGPAVLPGAVADSSRSISRQPPAPVRPTRFAVDARRLAPLVAARDGDRTEAAPQALAGEVGSCPPGAWGGGRYVRVGYGRVPGWLVFRPPRGETSVVELFLCGQDEAQRSATLSLD